MAEQSLDWSGYLNQFWQVASPYVSQYVYGGKREGDNYTLIDANNNGRLNGSGSPDRNAASGAPTSVRDLLFGEPGTNSGDTAGNKSSLKKFLLIGVAAVALWWILKKL